MWNNTLLEKETPTQLSLLGEASVIERADYLNSQLITYIGNKRALLGFIKQGIHQAQRELGQEAVSFLDLFSGTGVVSRMAKQYASRLIANDLEYYSFINNHCYLTNASTLEHQAFVDAFDYVEDYIKHHFNAGFITELYAPSCDEHIKPHERVFYTRRNAMYLDTASQAIATLPEQMRPYFLGPLLSQASMHVNTSGVFKGFYKNKQGVGQFGGTGRNALVRILKDIHITSPILSAHKCPCEIHQQDANALVRMLDPVDIAYLDPPYNQHPYGSNYFMLNLLCDYKKPEALSPVSGIPVGWNRSAYNKKAQATQALFDVVDNCNAKFVLISYNSEGFISYDEFVSGLETMGRLNVLDTHYNTFRGCRNLRDRDSHVTEFLYLLDKR